MDPSVIKAPFDPIMNFGETGVNFFNSALTKADENNNEGTVADSENSYH